MFSALKSGKKRIFIGSTAKCGTEAGSVNCITSFRLSLENLPESEELNGQYGHLINIILELEQ